MIIELDGIPIHILRKPVKSMHLRIYPPDGTVKLSTPLKSSERLIRNVLEQKTRWIHEQRARILNRPSADEPVLQTGAFIPWQGKNYLLIIEEHNGPGSVQRTDELIQCYLPHNSSQAQRQKIIECWYKQQMMLLLPQLILDWETIIGVKVNQWRIRKMKTRWGSCNPRAARIWLNLSLIKKPQVCLEYVLVHELIHLLEPSHNQRFYDLMSKFMPRWQEYHQLLEGR